MNQETLRMQFLSGVITEGQYKIKLQENQDIPNDIEWEVEDIGDWVDPPYTRTLYMSGYIHSTGEEFEAYADGVDGGGGNWEWDDLEDITRAQPKNKKSLKENFVGMSAINNPFPERKKEKYEDAFEHFLGEKYKLNEEVFSIKFKNVEEGRTYTATTDFGIFKKGDKVLVDNIRNLGAEVVLELENTDGKTDSIKGDLEEEIEVFS
jgi:hypothetical protein